jgi:hypothetical protein
VKEISRNGESVILMSQIFKFYSGTQKKLERTLMLSLYDGI